MRSFKLFWPLYPIYAIEVVIFAIALLLIAAAKSALTLDGMTIGAGSRAMMMELGTLHIVLAAPVVIGFFFRLDFIRGLWIACAWLHAIMLGGRSLDGVDWIVTALLFSYPAIATAVLVFSRAGRSYFDRTLEIQAPDEPKAHESRFERPAEALLYERLRRREITQAERTVYPRRLMVLFLVGGALFVWGAALKLFLVGLLGFTVVVVCFILHRKSTGNRRLVFYNREPSDG